MASRTDPLSRTESYTYDFNGNAQTVTDRKGQTTTHTYDPRSRRIRSDYADGPATTFSYDSVGNLLTATDSLTGTIIRSYDALNRLAEEVTPQGAITYAYDAANRRTSMQVNGLPPVIYGYDEGSRLTGIVQGPQTATLSYDPANRRSSLILPNGITVSYDYDVASRLIAQTYTGPSGFLGDLQYSYDANGNRIATGGSWARTGIPNPVSPTSYDAANQQIAFGPVTQTFDANGNLLAQTDASGTTTYTWDARNRLVAVTGPTMIGSFSYDAVGRRIIKTINAQTTTLLYDGLDIIQENGGAGGANYFRTLAIDETLTRIDATGTIAYLADSLGSTMVLTDSSGSPTTEYTYEPFGLTKVAGQPSPSPFQFTGRENDGSVLYYYRNRAYGPATGRFLQEDPMGLSGGVNLYVYVENSPLGNTDPLGLQGGPPPAPPQSYAPVGTPGGPVVPNPGSLGMQLKQLANVWGLKNLLQEIREKMEQEQDRVACGQKVGVWICWMMTTTKRAAQGTPILGTVTVTRGRPLRSSPDEVCVISEITGTRGCCQNCCPRPLE